MFWRQIRGHLAGQADFPAPDLIVGVGHATHLPMLIARRVCGGRTVVLMKPSLPHHLFDLIFVPRHDRYQSKGNLVGTSGVICPSTDEGKEPDQGLILLGGPNRTFDWPKADIAHTLNAIVRASPEIRWTVCDSRRTPEGMAAQVSETPNVAWQSWQTAATDFLESALARASYVWVTADSVSMLYEALSAQARVGVIGLPTRRRSASKYSRGIDLLRQQGHVFGSDDGYRLQDAPLTDFYPENHRCAQIVLERLVQPV